MRGNSIVRHLGESYDEVVLVGGFSKAYSSLLAFVACPTERSRTCSRSRPPPYLYSGPVARCVARYRRSPGFDVNERKGDELRADLHRMTAARPGLPSPALGAATPNRSGLPIIEVPLARPRADRCDVGRFLFERGIYVTLAAYPLVPKRRGRVPHPGHRREHRRADRAARSACSTRAVADRFALQPAAACDRESEHSGTCRVSPMLTGSIHRAKSVCVECAYTRGMLAIGGACSSLYLLVPRFAGERRPLFNFISGSSVVAIVAGVAWYRPS